MPGANAANIEHSLRDDKSRYALIVGDIGNRDLMLKTLVGYEVGEHFNCPVSA